LVDGKVAKRDVQTETNSALHLVGFQIRDCQKP
jgi:hypothetical protein